MVEYVVYFLKPCLNNGIQSWNLIENCRYGTFEEAKKSIEGKRGRYSIAKEVTTTVNEEVDNSHMRLKVYRMNDCEWWCTHLEIEEFYDWYLKEHGLDQEDNPLEDVEECDLDKDGMWWEYEDEYNKDRIAKTYERKKDNDVSEVHHTSIGSIDYFNNELCEMVSFRKAIDLYGLYNGSFLIACTEA